MIADDSEKIRNIIKKLLYRIIEDIDIIECSDGHRAIEAYNSARPDWVLMDIEMKPVNGLTATSSITKEHPQAKIVIVTQYNEPEFREAAKNAGAVAFLCKDSLSDLTGIIGKGHVKNLKVKQFKEQERSLK
jgi:DNA-binding NarL/FixJ family response regulator